MIERLTIPRQISPRLLVLAAIAFHLLLTVSLYAMGRLALFRLVDANGVLAMSDSVDYLPQVRALAEILARDGVSSWFSAPFPDHLKVYSLGFAALAPWLGATILCAEPVNLLCYIVILFLTFKLGEEVFGRSVGLAAAVAVAVWPSFLLHTTQLLKDPLFICALLLLLLVMTYWLTRNLSLQGGLTAGLVGGAALYIVSFTRNELWGAIMLALTAIGAGLLLLRHVREKRLLAGNLVSVILVLSAMSTVLLSSRESFRTTPRPQDTAEQVEPVRTSFKERADSAARRISQLRHEVIRLNKDAGSNIDDTVEFNGIMEVLCYLPRAMMIGFLAPFANQWFGEGAKVGMLGRLIGGLEMLVMYFVEVLVLISLWRSRSRFPVWLLFCVTAVGVTSLALAIVNVGALYRARYAFFIPLIIIGMNELVRILFSSNEQRTAPAPAQVRKLVP
jgi:hypothetical protein